MNRLRYAALCLLLIAALGCMKEETTTEEAAESADAETLERQTYMEIVEDINDQVPSLHMVQGTYTAGDATSDYRAYYNDDGDLLFMHEHMDMGEYGSATNRYYFHNGSLLYTEEDKLSRGMSETGQPQTRMIVQWMVFDSTGTAIQAEKNIDGKPRAPEADEDAAVYKHAEELRNAASHNKGDMHMGAGNPAME